MWQRSQFNYNDNCTKYDGRKGKQVFGADSKVPSPNYGSVAPVIQSQNQMPAGKLPLKMVVSDVVHRDTDQPIIPASSSTFIMTTKTRKNPYYCRRSVLNKDSHIMRNHYIVDEIQNKFKSIYGSNFQYGVKGLLNDSASLGESLQTEAETMKQERNVPKFSSFYKEFLEKQQSALQVMGFSSTNGYDNFDNPSAENKQENDMNQIQNNVERKDTNSENEVQFMVAENFLHSFKETPENEIEDVSPSKTEGSEAEDEMFTSSSEEYCSDDDNFNFIPVSNEINQDEFNSLKTQSTPQFWNENSNSTCAENVNDKESEISGSEESAASYSPDEHAVDWFTRDIRDDVLH